MSIDKVKEKILQKAEKEAEEILSRAKEEIEKEKALFLKEKQAELEERLEKASREIEDEIRKKIDREKLLAEREILAVKRKFIDETFNLTTQKFLSMDKKSYLKFLENLILKDAPPGKSELVLNKRDRELFDEKLLKSINRKLGKERTIALSGRTAEIKGGCVIRGNEVEIDDSLETLINDEREHSEIEIVKKLFGEEK